MKHLKRLTALLLTLVMLLGIPISANAIQDWYGVSDPLQYTSDLHIGSYTYRAGTSSTVMRLDETNRIAYCICLLYTSPSPRDRTRSRMPSSA